MNVLVTNNTLAGLGGSETYAYTLIRELHSRPDINVTGFSRNIGMIGNKLKEQGINIINKAVGDYDLILASHTTTIPFIKGLKGTKIQTCHGIYDNAEQPVMGMDGYVGISQEVYDHLYEKGIVSTVIHNGIDCDRFKSTTPLNKELKSILSLTHSVELNGMLQNVCDKMGIKLKLLNKLKNPIFNVEDEINKSDLVVSLGRGVYESLACGRNVLILDKRPYIKAPPLGDGLIFPNNMNDFIKNNCSGRYSYRNYNEELIEAELLKYDSSLGDFGREYALKNLNIKHQADKYLNIL